MEDSTYNIIDQLLDKLDIEFGKICNKYYATTNITLKYVYANQGIGLLRAIKIVKEKQNENLRRPDGSNKGDRKRLSGDGDILQEQDFPE